MVSQRQRCIANCKSTANMDLYQKIADFGNKKLGHMWDFTADEVLKVVHTIILYSIEYGAKSDKKELEDIELRTLEWQEGDGAVKLITYSV